LEEGFDVMLIDLKLPPLNGLETYLSIRDFRPDLVVIVITGYPQETRKLVKQALKENAYSCLEKPINMDELISLLGQIKEESAKGILKEPE
jgi:DNA-binding NtrC family response regulator